jgi:hypothetical protein
MNPRRLSEMAPKIFFIQLWFTLISRGMRVDGGYGGAGFDA